MVKLCATVNCEDNFALAVYRAAYDGAMDILCADILGNDAKLNQEATDWFNQHADDKKFRAFVLPICREMYRLLRV